MSEFANILKEIVGTNRSTTASIFDAVVKSVDVNNRTCIVTMIGGESSNEITVRLMASLDDGAYMIPKVDSTVVVVNSNYVQPLVIMYSEVERIVWLGGEYEGVPIVKHPTNTNLGLLKQINDLKDKINTIISTFNAHTHTVATTGTAAAQSGTAAPVASPISGTLTPTVQSDIEHPNIKH